MDSRDAKEFGGVKYALAKEESTEIDCGHLLAVNSTTHAVPAADEPDLRVEGISQGKYYDDEGYEIPHKILCRSGCFAWFQNDEEHPITERHVRDAAHGFIKDSETVCDEAGSMHRVKAGLVKGLDPMLGVLIYIPPWGF